MFITRKKYEKNLRKAKKQGAKEAYERCSMHNTIDSVNRNMYDNADRLHMELDKVIARLSKLESKRSEKKTIE